MLGNFKFILITLLINLPKTPTLYHLGVIAISPVHIYFTIGKSRIEIFKSSLQLIFKLLVNRIRSELSTCFFFQQLRWRHDFNYFGHGLIVLAHHNTVCIIRMHHKKNGINITLYRMSGTTIHHNLP